MSLDNISTLEARYRDSCKRHKVQPKSEVLSWLHKAVIQRSNQQKCTIVVFLDQLNDRDVSPLIDVLLDVQCEAVSIISNSPCALNEESILFLICAASSKLQVVDFQDISVGKDILCDIFQGGLNVHQLNVRFNEFKTINFAGSFMLLHTLNLDFCSSLNLENDCFAHMPNLRRISICGTRVANLWTTSAALSRLTSLVELRFQNCVCCKDTRSCPALSTERRDLACDRKGPQHSSEHSKSLQKTISVRNIAYCTTFQDESSRLVSAGDSFINCETHTITQNSTADRLVDKLSCNHHGISSLHQSSYSQATSIGMSELQIQVYRGKLEIEEETESPTSVLNLEIEGYPVASKIKVLENPSPICFENYYREYMITTLPHLQVLDNIPIRRVDREMARTVFSAYFEYLPYKRKHKESIVRTLHMRETGTSCTHQEKFTRKRQSSSCRKSNFFYTRSISAAKLGSSATMSQVGSIRGEGGKSLRPRQFEYHPHDSALMGFGTLDGEVVVINHEKGSIFKYIPAFRSPNSAVSAMALCWLNNHPSKLLAGYDNGSLRLYDINQVITNVEDICWTSCTKIYNDFNQLTSVHVNSTDEKFLASGYSKKLAVYDVCTGIRLQLFTDIHQEAINVAKFAHYSPHLLVTSSYDRDVKMWDIRQKPTQPSYTASSSRGNVMVCFSPDDLFLLVSAVDNEVKQLLAVDGRLHMRFEIPSTGSSHNFTRSYYMNGRDYIISGSSDESVVRIFCAQTGRRFRDIHMEDRRLGSSMHVQSLRGDPFRHFHMAVLAACVRPSSRWEIIKVNLLASSIPAKEHPKCQDFCLPYGWGG